MSELPLLLLLLLLLLLFVADPGHRIRLSNRYVATRLLGSRVRRPRRTQMFFSHVHSLLCRYYPLRQLITRLEEFCRGMHQLHSLRMTL